MHVARSQIPRWRGRVDLCPSAGGCSWAALGGRRLSTRACPFCGPLWGPQKVGLRVRIWPGEPAKRGEAMQRIVVAVIVLMLGTLGWGASSFGEKVPAPRGELRIVDTDPNNWGSITFNVFGSPPKFGSVINSL